MKRAATELLAALEWSRMPYVPAARNAPSSATVSAQKRSRLASAERALREALGEPEPGARATGW